MPVLRETKIKAKAARDNPVVMAELEEAFKAAGLLTRDQLITRIDELANLDRPLTGDEGREFNRLVKRWYRLKARREAADRRAAKARKRWAEFSPDERAEWDALALAEHRRHDRSGVHRALSGEEYHFLFVTAQFAKMRRRQAKEQERLRAKWAAEAAERAARRATVESDDAEIPTAAPAPSRPVEPEPAEAARPRRQRVAYGVVAQYDAFGRRVM